MFKLSDSNSIALPDPNAGSAEDASVPLTHIANKPAPGLKGPAGLSPRTSYSRVNTGSPPIPDAGASGQKSMSPGGLEFLPKTASEDFMHTMIERPTLQDMLKAAMEGTINKVDITNEAARQLYNQGDDEAPVAEKMASTTHFSTDYIEKLSDAIGYIAEKLAEDSKKEAATGHQQKPGEGPGALHVMQATSSMRNVDAGEQGQAKTQLPVNPGTKKLPGQKQDPGTAMETNVHMQHGEQPVDPWHNEKAKLSEAADQSLVERLKKLAAGLPGAPTFAGRAGGVSSALVKPTGAQWAPGHSAAGRDPFHGMALPKSPIPAPPAHVYEAAGMAQPKVGMAQPKVAAAPVALLRKLAGEDEAPATISAGPAVPPDASSAEQGVPVQPSDVNRQTNMVDSNMSAINYTKGQAKADPKTDVNKVLVEKALSSATDKTLERAFAHTGQAGVKISAADTSDASIKVAAARALLSKIASEVDDKRKNNKEKDSAFGGPTPQAATGVNAASMGS